MKLNKLSIIIAGIVLLGAGCNQVATNSNQSGSANTNQTSANQNVFTDEVRKISLDYSGLPVQTQPPSSYIPPHNNFPSNGENLLALYLNPSTYAGTNAESGWFNLAVNSKLDKAQCYSATAGLTGVTYNKARTIQGNQWYYSLPNPRGDAAAGHVANVETYRLYKNNLCYEATLGVSAFNRQNLPNPNSVKEYDQQKLFGYLGSVLNNLKIQ